MKYLFLTGALLAWATLGRAQCGCGKLWLAMDDNRQYKYSYRVAREGDTATVKLPSGSTGSTTPFSHKSAADRPHSWVHLPAYQTTSIHVDVTDVVTHQQMQLILESRGMDKTYRLLVDFAPGSRYQLALETLAHAAAARFDALPAGFEVLPTEKRADGTYWLKLHRK